MSCERVEAPVDVELEEEDDPGHIAWTADLEFAVVAGVDVQALCGVWMKPFIPRNLVEVVGGLMPVYKRRDCSACRMVFDRFVAEWARQVGVDG